VPLHDSIAQPGDFPLRPGSTRARPLVATGDADLLDDLLRLAAAADVEVDVTHDAVATRRCWSAAPLVVVGSDLVMELLRLPPPRRESVVLVGLDLDDAGVWERAVDIGAEHVVFLPDAEAWVVDRLADAADGDGADATTVCVLGGRGGAGATTTSVALALTATRRGLRTLLVDGDPLGGGIDLVLGGEETAGLRWPDLAAARGRVNGTALRDALPRVEELTVLSWDRGDTLTVPPDAMQAVLAGGRRSSDLVVVDLPRRLDEAAEVALARAHVALLVVRPARRGSPPPQRFSPRTCASWCAGRRRPG
jgi:secretion/DNA translocation related CpaE-like protein